VVLGPREVVYQDSGLAGVFVRTAVPRIEPQRLVLMGEGGSEIAGVAVGEAEIVLDVGVAGVASRCRGEQRDRTRPVRALDRALALGIVGIAARAAFLLGRVGTRRRRDAGRAQCGADQEPSTSPFVSW
jgi:hypothetical protein